MNTWLTEEKLWWSYTNKKLPCAPTLRYPDYLFCCTDHAVLLEVDEHEHTNYNATCEIARLSEIMDSINHKCLHVIRYNPHSLGNTEGKRKRIIDTLRDAMSTNLGRYNDSGCVVQYVGYSENRINQLEDISCRSQKI